MAKPRVPQYDEIVYDLSKGLHPKAVAMLRHAALSTVYEIRRNCFDFVQVLKDNLPDPRQLTMKF